MTAKQTRIYYNTGFNPGNTPGYVSLLNSASYRDFDTHMDYQDYFLSSLKLHATWDDVKNADYLKFGNGYYWVTGIQMINENNAQLSLQLDALATMGGAQAINYSSGLLKRAHPKAGEDTAFANLLEEPVGPQRSLSKISIVEAGSDDLTSTPVYVSTLSLDQDITTDAYGNVMPENPRAVEYKTLALAGDEEREVIVPASPKPAYLTFIDSHAFTGYGCYTNTLSGDKKIDNQMAYLRSLGLEQAVIGAYALPHSYGTVSSRGANHIEAITSKSYNADGGAWEGTKATTWKKTKYMNNTYVVVSRLSGEVKVYKASDICKIGNNSYTSSPTFKIGADVNINGKPYIWPRYFDGADNQNYIGANGVTGIEWLNLPVVVGGASGSLWIKNDYVRSKAEIATDTLQMGTNAVLGVVRGIAGSAGTSQYSHDVVNDYGIAMPQAGTSYNLGSAGLLSNVTNTAVNTIFNANKLEYRADKIDMNFDRATKFAVPSISGNVAQGLQTKIPNNFLIYHYMMDSEDMDKIDAFFTKYGYAQDCIFDKTYMDVNVNGYCYIQTEDIHISRDSGTNYGIGIKNLAEQQLNGGVRIWHQLPN